MVCERCLFRTDRLDVRPWHLAVGDAALVRAVTAMLTPPVTRALPTGWQGPFNEGRARRWIAERDIESTMLLARERAHGESMGLLILHEEPAPTETSIEIRLGYLLAETAWGKGLGGELVSGLVDWCREQPEVGSLAGGVDAENVASARLLERIGFEVAERDGATSAGEVLYRLRLHADRPIRQDLG